MTREIVTINDILKLNRDNPGERGSSGSTYQEKEDTYFDRLFKYIPAEIVAGYLFVQGVMKQLTGINETILLQWILFIVFCILTPMYLWRIQKVIKTEQHIISLLSFMVWCFALGGPFSFYGWYNPVYGQILLAVFTLVAAIWEAR